MRGARAVALLTLCALVFGALAAAPDAQAGPSRKDVALVRSLQTQRLKNVKFEKVSLRDFIRWIRTASGHNYMLKMRPLVKAGIDPDDIEVTLSLEDVTVATLLKLVLEPYDLAVVVRGNVVWITTHADSLGKPVTRIYSIAHITWTKVDFIAPEINLRPSNFTPVEDYEPERIVEDDPLSTGDAVAELLQEIVMPGEWDNEGWGIRATDRYLVVRCPRNVHPQVDRAIAIIATMK